MVIEINKDIDRYKESVVLGLTARQLIYSVLSVLLGGGIVLLTYPYVGLTTSAYIAIPVVAPIALTGFYSYNGMTFMEMMKLKLHFAFGNKAFTYISTESPDMISKVKSADEMANKKKGFAKGVKAKDKLAKTKNCDKKQSQISSKAAVNKTMMIMLVTVFGLIALFVAAALIIKMHM